MSMPAAHDPARTSYYVNDALYDEVIEAFTNWQRDDLVVTDHVERDLFRRLIEEEARLLDNDRLEDWLKLFARECVYWAPATVTGGDPRREVAISFDDRRRMEDRIYRLRTGFAWSQKPKSRTVRLVSNVEVFRTTKESIRMVRSNFLINEFRGIETRTLPGWAGHRYVERNGRWEIQARQVNLLECDQCIRNPSIVI